MHIRTFRNRTLALAAVGALTITGTALAAHPKASQKYSGATSAKRFNGYRSGITFSVSSSGKQLKNVSYQSIGCYGAGGLLKKGVNYLKQAANTHKLGTVSVASNGSFSKHHVITHYTTGGSTTTTITTITGSFKSSSKATGKISFSQTVSGKGVAAVKPCSAKVTFTADLVQQFGGY